MILMIVGSFKFYMPSIKEKALVCSPLNGSYAKRSSVNISSCISQQNAAFNRIEIGVINIPESGLFNLNYGVVAFTFLWSECILHTMRTSYFPSLSILYNIQYSEGGIFLILIANLSSNIDSSIIISEF